MTMDLPQRLNASLPAAVRDSQTSQPLHERLTQRWQQLPATAKQAMHRTLGSRVLASLPANLSLQRPGHQTERGELQTESLPQRRLNQPALLSEVVPSVSYFPTSLGFVALLSAYRASGGTVRADDLSRHVRSEEPGHLTNLARKLVSGSILSFSWRETLWVPLFQFEANGCNVKPDVARVVDELTGAFDSWEIAVWFVQPNSSLKGQRPLTLLGKLDAEVLQAARVDRFVAMG
jgi:hypothetical protein